MLLLLLGIGVTMLRKQLKTLTKRRADHIKDVEITEQGSHSPIVEWDKSKLQPKRILSLMANATWAEWNFAHALYVVKCDHHPSREVWNWNQHDTKWRRRDLKRAWFWNYEVVRKKRAGNRWHRVQLRLLQNKLWRTARCRLQRTNLAPTGSHHRKFINRGE